MHRIFCLSAWQFRHVPEDICFLVLKYSVIFSSTCSWLEYSFVRYQDYFSVEWFSLKKQPLVVNQRSCTFCHLVVFHMLFFKIVTVNHHK